MKKFFIPQNNYKPEEWMLQYKVISILVMTVVIGSYSIAFAIYRLSTDNIIVGIMELIVGFVFAMAFIVLRKDISYYYLFSKLFFILLYFFMVILFLYVPNEMTSMLWTPAALVIVFFLHDYKGGILFLFLFILFILIIFFLGTHHKSIDLINWVASLSAIAWVMYFYEKLKEKETSSLADNANFLEKEITKKTEKLQELNHTLEMRVQEELAKQEKQEKMLLHQCRQASMGEMIDSIAHQWRQPLMNINAILMNMDRAIETKDKSDVYMENKMNEVVALTTHMSQTIEDFRSLFKEDKTKDSFNIYRLITYSLNLLKNLLHDVQIDIQSDKKILYYGYKNELAQVFLILLSNASEILHARKIKNKSLVIKLIQDNAHIIISIQDNGKGIDEKILEKIFEPYFTTKERTGGTGLGLYVAKIIIEQNMQGFLQVSNTNKGAKFTITLRRNDVKPT